MSATNHFFLVLASFVRFALCGFGFVVRKWRTTDLNFGSSVGSLLGAFAMAQLPKPKLNLYLTTPYLRAIGHVMAQWAYIEREINTELQWLLKRRPNRKEKINFQARFSRRVADWVRLASAVCTKRADEMTTIHSIAGQAVTIKKERDDLAHATFGRTGTKFHYMKFHEGKIIRMDEQFRSAREIEQLACRISEIGSAILHLQIMINKRYRDRD